MIFHVVLVAYLAQLSVFCRMSWINFDFCKDDAELFFGTKPGSQFRLFVIKQNTSKRRDKHGEDQITAWKEQERAYLR